MTAAAKPWKPKHQPPPDWPTLADYDAARRARWAAQDEPAPVPKKARKR